MNSSRKEDPLPSVRGVLVLEPLLLLLLLFFMNENERNAERLRKLSARER